MNKIGKIFLFLIFISYLAFLIMILFVRYGVDLSLSFDAIRERVDSFSNFTPFFTISNYYRAYSIGNISKTVFVYNIVGNLLLFLPMGYLLPCVSKHKRALKTLPALLIILPLVEVIQLMTGLGRFDVDDMILNLSGAVTGYLLYLIFHGRRLSRNKKRKRTQANT